MVHSFPTRRSSDLLLNEYRLNPARREDQEVIVKQMEQYFFGEGAAPPPEYVAPEQKQ